jgi:hypothetical protein
MLREEWTRRGGSRGAVGEYIMRGITTRKAVVEKETQGY